ncbi:hypothetical protein [Virgibacillus sediminis]|uniref:Uncharacterized protein n=1 Tax=Virgibacillus sediminis TaxID=202260 RepID=A0ABV7A8N6_9BACI
MSQPSEKNQLYTCSSCTTQPTEESAGGIRKWLPKICIGHVAMAAGMIYILASQIMMM